MLVSVGVAKGGTDGSYHVVHYFISAEDGGGLAVSVRTAGIISFGGPAFKGSADLCDLLVRGLRSCVKDQSAGANIPPTSSVVTAEIISATFLARLLVEDQSRSAAEMPIMQHRRFLAMHSGDENQINPYFYIVEPMDVRIMVNIVVKEYLALVVDGLSMVPMKSEGGNSVSMLGARSASDRGNQSGEERVGLPGNGRQRGDERPENHGIRLNRGQWRRMKQAALDQDRRLYEVLGDAVDQYLESQRNAAGR